MCPDREPIPLYSDGQADLFLKLANARPWLDNRAPLQTDLCSSHSLVASLFLETLVKIYNLSPFCVKYI